MSSALLEALAEPQLHTLTTAAGRGGVPPVGIAELNIRLPESRSLGRDRDTPSEYQGVIVVFWTITGAAALNASASASGLSALICSR